MRIKCDCEPGGTGVVEHADFGLTDDAVAFIERYLADQNLQVVDVRGYTTEDTDLPLLAAVDTLINIGLPSYGGFSKHSEKGWAIRGVVEPRWRRAWVSCYDSDHDGVDAYLYIEVRPEEVD